MQNKSPPNHPVIHTPATCLSPTSHLLLLPSIQGNYPTILTSASFYFLYIDCRLVAIDSSRSFSTCAFGSTFARLHSTTADLRATYIVPYYYLPTPFTWETRKNEIKQKIPIDDWLVFLYPAIYPAFLVSILFVLFIPPPPRLFPRKPSYLSHLSFSNWARCRTWVFDSLFICLFCALACRGNCANEVWFLVLCFRLRGILGWLQSSRLCMYLPSRLSFSPYSSCLFSPLHFSRSACPGIKRIDSAFPPLPSLACLLALSLARARCIAHNPENIPPQSDIRVMQEEETKVQVC